MNQELVNWMIVVLTGVGGWFMKSIWEAVKELQKETKAIELLITGDYVTRSEFSDSNTIISLKLDKILDKMDKKADK